MESEELEGIKNLYPDLVIDTKNYCKIKSIGKGGFAEVWLVQDEENGKKYALKELYDEKMSTKRIKSFVREIKTLAKADHPLLVKIVGFSSHFPLSILTEYVSKGSLYNVMHTEKKSLTGTKKTLIAMGVAHAMMTLHSFGIIHRDLKSMNVLLDSQYLPRICDFGIARFYGKTDSTLTANIGTPHWMAPEILANLNYSYPVDVYGYSMLLYEMVTGLIPWSTAQQYMVTRMVVEEGKRPRLPKATPVLIKDLIRKCWAQDPEARPSFTEIYEMFTSGAVAFPKTNPDDVENLANLLKKVKLGNKFQEAPKPIIKPPKTPTSDKKRDWDSGADDIDILAEYRHLNDVSDPKFERDLNRAFGALSIDTAEDLFSVIGDHLEQSLTVKQTRLLLNKLTSAAKNQWAARAIMKQRIHLVLPFDYDRLFDNAMNLTFYLFKNSPQLFNKKFKPQMKIIINQSPSKALTLLEFFAKHFNNVADPWSLLDLLFEKSDKFIKDDNAAKDYAIFLYYMCSTYMEFKASRIDVCMDAWYDIIDQSSQSEAVSFSFEVLASYYTPERRIPSKMLSKALKNDIASKGALRYLMVADRPKLTKGLLDGLFRCASHEKEAILVLCKFAESEDNALAICYDCGWMNSNLPTLTSTLRLVLAVCVHPSVREQLASTPEIFDFLRECCNEEDPRIFVYISSIIRKLPQSERLIGKLREHKVLKKVLQTSVNCEDPIALAAALQIIQACAECDDAPEYLIVVPKLAEIAKSGGDLSGEATSLVVSLSRFQLCALKFVELKMEKHFERLLEIPEYEKEAQDYFKNVEVASYYNV